MMTYIEPKLPVEVYEVGLSPLLGFHKLTVSFGVTGKVHRRRGRLSPALPYSLNCL